MYARCHSSTSILHGSKLMFAQSILCSILPTQLACQRDTASDIGSLEVPHLWVVLPAISMKFLHINEIPASKCAWRGSIFPLKVMTLTIKKSLFSSSHLSIFDPLIGSSSSVRSEKLLDFHAVDDGHGAAV